MGGAKGGSVEGHRGQGAIFTHQMLALLCSLLIQPSTHSPSQFENAVLTAASFGKSAVTGEVSAGVIALLCDCLSVTSLNPLESNPDTQLPPLSGPTCQGLILRAPSSPAPTWGASVKTP